MKTSLRALLLITLLSLQSLGAGAATLYVDLNSASPTPPYAGWNTAATNIQDAIDAATDGDLVLVTNGVYATGGKVKFGDLTNRVALDKAITVQSVNGPWVTTIRGAGATNGPAAVRCAWITNGATLQGFTLTAGATRTSGDQTDLLDGGGALCWSTNALLRNCLIISNVAQTYGGGVYQGVVANSAILGNRATTSGSGAAYATLLNCTVVSNWQTSATFQSRHTNSIIYYNTPANYSGGSFAYCCTLPAPGGVGNITAAPQLYADAFHLLETSPCRNAGTNIAIGADIDQQAWNNPPAIGCDEWLAQPTIVLQPSIRQTIDPIGFTVSVTVAGAQPLTCYWSRNDLLVSEDVHFSQVTSTNLVATGITDQNIGGYQVVVSNAFGVVTSAVAQLSIRYVSATTLTPMAPYTSWATAATNIQDAIDVAVDGDLVLVTNGVYGAGGKVMEGDLTNRIAINKVLAVRSVNGPTVTIIRGSGAVNGTSAVRCAWLTDGAILHGFTLTGGATRTSGNTRALDSGGGVWCLSINATVASCIIRSNASAIYGCGVYQGTVRNSYLTANQSGNVSWGVIASANVLNCTIVSNASYGLVAVGGNPLRITNSIVYYNSSAPVNYGGITFAYSCISPLPLGSGNISNAPLFQSDGMHLSAASPCRGTGTNLAVGSDLFGQLWATPPSMGCVEWNPVPAVERQPVLTLTNNPGGFAISFKSDGPPPLTYYWYHEANLLADNGRISGTATTNLVARKIRPEDAGNYWVVVSNSFGMVTSQVASLVMHYVNAAGAMPMSPYTNWNTAASSIQDAIDAAQPGEVVMVTNGVYNIGGKTMSGGPTNRVVLDRAITVISVNGYRDTVIEGNWNPVSTNGPAAVRGVWMATGAGTLLGFTIRNGATLAGSGIYTFPHHCGGGIYAFGNPYAQIYNCLLTNNAAQLDGGGAYGANLRNSFVIANYAIRGSGGGVAHGDLRQCTITRNHAGRQGGGVYGDAIIDGRLIARNSIILGNSTSPTTFNTDVYVSPVGVSFGSDLANCCFSFSGPPLGTNNINTLFQAFPFPFVDSLGHIPVNSICRGQGDSLYSSNEDMDGEPWANPPSMGADEVVEANLTGPLAISIYAPETNTLVNASTVPLGLGWHRLYFLASTVGRVTKIDWDYGDGLIETNLGFSAAHKWDNPGTYTLTSTAYNMDNPTGVSASVVINVLPLIAPSLQMSAVTSGGYNFGFMAQTNANYTVQYTTNLAAPIAWQTLKTIYFSPGGTTFVTDPTLTNVARFYRVQAW